MKIKRFNEDSEPDLYKEVEKLDAEWSEAGMTCDAEDVYDELVERFPDEFRKDIKSAVESFYEIDLDIDID